MFRVPGLWELASFSVPRVFGQVQGLPTGVCSSFLPLTAYVRGAQHVSQKELQIGSIPHPVMGTARYDCR